MLKIISFGILFFISSFTMAKTVLIKNYPDQEKAQIILVSDIDELIIGDGCRRLGFPTSENLERLKSIASINTQLKITSKQFPNEQQTSRLNKLGQNVRIELDIRNYFNMTAELNWLSKISRPASITTYCSDDNWCNKANKLKNKLKVRTKEFLAFLEGPMRGVILRASRQSFLLWGIHSTLHLSAIDITTIFWQAVFAIIAHLLS